MTMKQKQIATTLRRRRKLGRIRQERYCFRHPERRAQTQRDYHVRRQVKIGTLITSDWSDEELIGLSLKTTEQEDLT
jgi:hypothetical protein